jgi:hypothetical protein
VRGWAGAGLRSVCAGKPAAEMRELGKPPKILTLEEQGKMRTVCRVRRPPRTRMPALTPLPSSRARSSTPSRRRSSRA